MSKVNRPVNQTKLNSVQFSSVKFNTIHLKTVLLLCWVNSTTYRKNEKWK